MADTFDTKEDPVSQLMYRAGSVDSSIRHIKEAFQEFKTELKAELGATQKESRTNALDIKGVKSQIRTVATMAGAGGALILKGIFMFMESTNVDPSLIGSLIQ